MTAVRGMFVNAGLMFFFDREHVLEHFAFLNTRSDDPDRDIRALWRVNPGMVEILLRMYCLFHKLPAAGSGYKGPYFKYDCVVSSYFFEYLLRTNAGLDYFIMDMTPEQCCN